MGSKITKKRDLFRRDSGATVPTKEDVCLSDITEILGRLSAEASKLEVQNSIEASKRSIDHTFELESLARLYRDRMRDTRDEIKNYNKKSGKYKGNPDTLKKINENKQ